MLLLECEQMQTGERVCAYVFQFLANIMIILRIIGKFLVLWPAVIN